MSVKRFAPGAEVREKEGEREKYIYRERVCLLLVFLCSIQRCSILQSIYVYKRVCRSMSLTKDTHKTPSSTAVLA